MHPTPQRETRTFAPIAGHLTITKDSGDLDVRPADVDRVEVTRWFGGRALVGDDPTADWNFHGDELTLTTHCGAFDQCDVRYEVRVPRGVGVTVDGQNGTISATGFDAAVEIHSENGAISVGNSSGRLDLRSDSGEVRADGLTSKEVAADSDNGEVRLTFAAVPDAVAVSTQNGAVTVEVPADTYRVATTTDSGEVSVDLAKDAGSPHAISARTDNGAITLRTAS